jgi:N4-gp56 family major capsid protein
MSTIKAVDMPGIRAADSKLVGEVWEAAVLLQSQTEDVLGQMEGPENSGKPVCVKRALNKGRGDTVNFTVAKALGGSVRRGDAVLEGFEEKAQKATYNVKIDQIRHAVGYTELITDLMAAGHSLESAYATLLGQHFGRTKQEDALMSFRRYATFLNTVRPNNKATRAAITASDVFSTDLISDAAAAMSTRAAAPANVSKAKSKAKVEGFIFFGPDDLLRPLKADDAYLSALSHAGVRGDENLLFKGGYAQWDAHYIYHWLVKDHDTLGPIGSPLGAKALLGDAVTGANTAPVIQGSGTTIAALTALDLAKDGASYFEPFKFFEGYAYKLLSHETLTADSGVHYFIIYNVSGADAGKYGVYSYVGSANTGDKITVTNRLRAAASGAAVDELAGQAWNAAVHTDAHPTGSLIIQVNEQCVPYGYGLGLGANALVRAYGTIPMKRIVNRRDYDERKGMGYKSIYGQKPALDTTGQPRNYVLVQAAISYPGVRLTYA